MKMHAITPWNTHVGRLITAFLLLLVPATSALAQHQPGYLEPPPSYLSDVWTIGSQEEMPKPPALPWESKSTINITVRSRDSTVAAEDGPLSYPELGITSSLSLLHPSIGYWWNRRGVRLSGMYLKKDQHVFHLNFGYAVFDSEKVQHSINLLTSRISGSDPGADYRYWSTGIAYGVNFRGFFLELGLAHPWKDELGNLEDDPVIPCGYLGYIYRFRPD